MRGAKEGVLTYWKADKDVEKKPAGTLVLAGHNVELVGKDTATLMPVVADPKAKPLSIKAVDDAEAWMRHVQSLAYADRTFEVPLEWTVRRPCRKTLELPSVLTNCIGYLESHNALVEQGIYRISGSAVDIRQAKEAFNDNEFEVDFNELNEPHVVSGVLKLFLRELPEPLFTFPAYQKFINSQKSGSDEEKQQKARDVLATLPDINQRCIRFLFAHLKRVVEQQDVNKMVAGNVAIVFGPTCLRKKDGGDGGAFDTSVLTDMKHVQSTVTSLLACPMSFFTSS